MDRICGFVNGKGGVLKTTLTANVGALLAVSGWKVNEPDSDLYWIPPSETELDLIGALWRAA
jgi:MinD-like ATPase involved in chromosome partitioning or flagellar assembly